MRHAPLFLGATACGAGFSDWKFSIQAGVFLAYSLIGFTYRAFSVVHRSAFKGIEFDHGCVDLRKVSKILTILLEVGLER